MTGKTDHDDTYYRDRAASCRARAHGFLMINPGLADLYLTAANIWERLRFTRG